MLSRSDWPFRFTILNIQQYTKMSPLYFECDSWLSLKSLPIVRWMLNKRCITSVELPKRVSHISELLYQTTHRKCNFVAHGRQIYLPFLWPINWTCLLLSLRLDLVTHLNYNLKSPFHVRTCQGKGCIYVSVAWPIACQHIGTPDSTKPGFIFSDTGSQDFGMPRLSMSNHRSGGT